MWSQQIRRGYYKTLGTSVINCAISPSFLGLKYISVLARLSFQFQFKYSHNKILNIYIWEGGDIRLQITLVSNFFSFVGLKTLVILIITLLWCGSVPTGLQMNLIYRRCNFGIILGDFHQSIVHCLIPLRSLRAIDSKSTKL